MTSLRLFMLPLLCAGFAGSAAAEDDITVNGVSMPVTVQLDEFGIPTITGDSERDVIFAQGYLHAADRFFQMDAARRQASGTSAELFGASQLASDIQLRTLGLRRAALASWSALDADTQAWLGAYADGVNTWLANNPLPPEYTVLEISKATPWSPVDSLVIGKALAFQLSFDLDIDLTIRALAYQQAGAIGGFDGAALFSEDTHRVAPMDDRVSVPGFIAGIGGIGGAAVESSKASPADSTQSLPETGPAGPALGNVNERTARLAARYRDKVAGIPVLAEKLEAREGRGGSNEWAVSGSHTANGVPLVANDPHLSLNLPPIFTEEQLIVTGDDGFTASGVGLPGAPGIIQGCNAHLCWGTTTNPLDVTDTYEETLVLNGLGLPTHTVFQGALEPVKWLFQSYFVNSVGDGEADNVARANVPYDGGTITVIVPRRNNGPLVEIDGSFGLSVQYIGWGPTRELESFRLINLATNREEFEAALQRFDVGSQNFIYADREGNIAYYTTGEMPLRADLQNDMTADGGIPPFLIRDGSGALNHEWLPAENPEPEQTSSYAILPWAEMPQSVNPEWGYLANANNDPVGVTLDNNALNQVRPGGGLYYLNAGYSENRMGRIDRVLQDLVARGDVTLDEMAELQANNQLLDAELLTPHLLEAFSRATADGAWVGIAQFAADPRVVEAAQRLAAWDFSTPTGLAEGWDPFDDPTALAPPTQDEIDASVAASIYSTWRGQMIQNTVDATLGAIGLGSFLPGSTEAQRAMAHLLTDFDQNQGIGASGIPFFNLPGVTPPTPADGRDALILASLQGALDLLASDDFAPAFGGSTNLEDYRWGKLHRIVFDHPLNADPFNVPNGGGLTDLGPGLPGVARAGGRDAVDASSHGARSDGLNEFMFGGGPARRFIGEVGPDGPVGEEVIPGGRSGVFLSPHYADQLPWWLTNQYHPLTLGADAADMGETASFQFLPASP